MIGTYCRRCETYLETAERKGWLVCHKCGHSIPIGNARKQLNHTQEENMEAKKAKGRQLSYKMSFMGKSFKYYTKDDMTAKDAFEKAAKETDTTLPMSFTKYPGSRMFALQKIVKKLISQKDPEILKYTKD